MTSMVMPWLQHAAAIPVKNNFIYFSSTKKNSKIKKENFAKIVDSAEMAQQDNEEVMGDDMDNNDDDVDGDNLITAASVTVRRCFLLIFFCQSLGICRKKLWKFD